ncbi:hypothetical protein I4U23_022697 [Adineta vaga]|nr:hypothetical protein I4U23_022697 [Adineta vaga]
MELVVMHFIAHFISETSQVYWWKLAILYKTNVHPNVDKFKENIQSDLVCFDIEKCPALTNVIVNITTINGLTCTPTSILTNRDQLSNFKELILSFNKVIREFLTKGTDISCKNSNEFHCNQSLKCISYHHVRDGHPDCSFEEDEEYLDSCSWNDSRRFQCPRIDNLCLSPVAIRNGFPDCRDREDETIYHKQDFNKTTPYSEYCLGLLAQHVSYKKYNDSEHCKLWPCNSPYVHCDKIWDCPNGFDELNCSYTNYEEKKKYAPMNISQTWFCHRGILVLSGNNQTKTCLCPPSYFGSQCQWQSQRISLTLQIILPRATFISASFQIIIMLINEQDEIVGNHEEILFTPARDCQTKFHLYLLYPQRPKSISNNYSIRIDLFNKITLKHWTSWYLSIPFQFLPVNRISTQLFIPIEQTIKECSLLCGLHGQCLQYTNNQSKYFCQCDQRYSGRFCNQSYQCQCSQESFCHSPNICICPLDRFGSKCYLKRSICFSINNPCQNGGLCIPTDDRINLHGYSCFCKERYFGLHCEYLSSPVSLKLDETITKTSSFVFIHFITTFQHAKHGRTTIMKKIPFDNDTIIFYISKQFHLIFLQLLNQSYYLAIVRETFIPFENIYGEILSKQNCPHARQYLNSTFLEYEQIYYPKYYSVICRQYLHLLCFYDENLLCICDLDRFANCFEFNHTIDNDCQGHNDCQNNGQCFQNNQTCPTMSICAYDQRIWCFVRYPSIVHNYNYFITLMHFVGPLIANIISAILIIIFVSRSRSTAQRNKSFHQHLQEQLKRHKHLLISPLALILLGTPRMIFSFVTGCMRTPRDSWLYVIGYYVSFIPPILTFPTFVLPSENYRKVFRSLTEEDLDEYTKIAVHMAEKDD